MTFLLVASSLEEHLKTLDRVFQTLKDAGLKLKRNKWVYLTESVTYLGHRIDAQGLHPEKIKALLEVPAPTNVTALHLSHSWECRHITQSSS